MCIHSLYICAPTINPLLSCKTGVNSSIVYLLALDVDSPHLWAHSLKTWSGICQGGNDVGIIWEMMGVILAICMRMKNGDYVVVWVLIGGQWVGWNMRTRVVMGMGLVRKMGAMREPCTGGAHDVERKTSLLVLKKRWCTLEAMNDECRNGYEKWVWGNEMNGYEDWRMEAWI